MISGSVARKTRALATSTFTNFCAQTKSALASGAHFLVTTLGAGIRRQRVLPGGGFVTERAKMMMIVSIRRGQNMKNYGGARPRTWG